MDTKNEPISKPVYNVIFILILTVLLFAAVELVIGYAYFQRNGRFPLSTMEFAHYLSEKTGRMRAEHYIGTVRKKLGGKDLEWGEISGALAQHLYRPEGHDLLDDFAKRYEEHFVALKKAVDQGGAKLVVMFIPGVEGKISRPWCTQFFRTLTAKHHVTYLDLSARFDAIGQDKLSFEPWNGHMSRYGHYIVAEELAKILEPLAKYKGTAQMSTDTRDFADNLPNLRQVVDIDPEHPYVVKTNRYGFRTDEDFKPDDPRQRVVILGDSLAYGPYVANEDTFSDMLRRRFPDRLFLNAAAAGYNIVHEAEMFDEKTRKVAPDIVILQVDENDIYSMYHYKLNEYDRHKRLNSPTPLEATHIKSVIEKLNAEKKK